MEEVLIERVKSPESAEQQPRRIEVKRKSEALLPLRDGLPQQEVQLSQCAGWRGRRTALHMIPDAAASGDAQQA